MIVFLGYSRCRLILIKLVHKNVTLTWEYDRIAHKSCEVKPEKIICNAFEWVWCCKMTFRHPTNKEEEEEQYLSNHWDKSACHHVENFVKCPNLSYHCPLLFTVCNKDRPEFYQSYIWAYMEWTPQLFHSTTLCTVLFFQQPWNVFHFCFLGILFPSLQWLFCTDWICQQNADEVTLTKSQCMSSHIKTDLLDCEITKAKQLQWAFEPITEHSFAL